MLNHIVIMGRLTKDPEIRYTQTGTPVASFSVAVDRNYADQSGKRETDFFSCVAWRQGAEFISKYFSKGSMIVVEGSMQARDWTDNNGNSRRSWEVNVEHSFFGESKKDGQKPNNSQGGYQANSYAARRNNGDIEAHNGFDDLEDTFTELPDDGEENPFTSQDSQYSQSSFDDLDDEDQLPL